jgi:hypothetical protein
MFQLLPIRPCGLIQIIIGYDSIKHLCKTLEPETRPWQGLEPIHDNTTQRIRPWNHRRKKVKLSLCLTNWALRHEGVWRCGGIAPLHLTSALVRGEWSGSHPGCFKPLGKTPSTHWIGGWVGSRALLSSQWPVTIPTALSRLRNHRHMSLSMQNTLRLYIT